MELFIKSIDKMFMVLLTICLLFIPVVGGLTLGGMLIVKYEKPFDTEYNRGLFLIGFMCHSVICLLVLGLMHL